MENTLIYIYVYIYITESLCCIPEVTQYCKSTILQFKKKKIFVTFKGMERDWEAAIPTGLSLYSVWSLVSSRSGASFPQVRLPPGCYIRGRSLFLPGWLTPETHALRNRSLIFSGLMLPCLISLSESELETPAIKPLFHV